MTYNYARKHFFATTGNTISITTENQTIAFLAAASSLWIVLFLFFSTAPEIDLVVAKAFFVETSCLNPAHPQKVCGHFPMARDLFYVGLRKFLFYVPIVAAVVLAGLLIRGALAPRRMGPSNPKPQRYLLALIALALGPGLLVNVLLKGFSGRPRPDDTDLFGGFHAFMPAGAFDGACPTNCSFVSGEAAGAGWVLCLLPFLPRRLQPYLAPPIIAICLITPALRIFFGGHYLSDAVLGWLLAIIVYAGVFSVADRLMRPKFDGKKH